MVLSLFVVGVEVPLAITNSPLFAGEVLIDAGAENSPLRPLIKFLLFLTLKFPEYEYGCCRRNSSEFPGRRFLSERNGFTNLTYLFRSSNFDFRFCVC